MVYYVCFPEDPAFRKWLGEFYANMACTVCITKGTFSLRCLRIRMGSNYLGYAILLHDFCSSANSHSVCNVGCGILHAHLDSSHSPAILCLADNRDFSEAALCCNHYTGMLTSTGIPSYADWSEGNCNCTLLWYRWLREL